VVRRMSQIRVLPGHHCMTHLPDVADLAAVTRDAQFEISAAEAAYPDGAFAPDVPELGYFQAELQNLRAAAIVLGEPGQACT
jgi:hypothetical protein